MDLLKNNKFKEIDNIFNKLKNNLLELKKNYLKTKKNLEDYYSTHKDFFNICTKDKTNNTSNNNDIDCQNNYNGITENNSKINNINNNDVFNNNKNNYKNNNNNNNDCIIKNKDIENTIFILNFDLMNICDNKNIEILDFVNGVKNKINIYLEEINQKTMSVKNNINHYLDISLDIDKNDDFYKDINLRVAKNTEHINLFKETISEIIRKTSNLEKVKDLINILESKNNKGKQQIFQQDFFSNPHMNNNCNTISVINNNKIFENKIIKTRQHSKNKKIRRGVSGDFKNLQKNKISITTNNTNINLNINNKQMLKLETENNNTSYNTLKTNLLKRDSSKNKKISISPFKTLGNNSKNNKITKSTSFYGRNTANPNYRPLNLNNIILNQRILQKFFAYSIQGLYSKYYTNKSKENVKKLIRKQ